MRFYLLCSLMCCFIFVNSDCNDLLEWVNNKSKKACESVDPVVQPRSTVLCASNSHIEERKNIFLEKFFQTFDCLTSYVSAYCCCMQENDYQKIS